MASLGCECCEGTSKRGLDRDDGERAPWSWDSVSYFLAHPYLMVHTHLLTHPHPQLSMESMPWLIICLLLYMFVQSVLVVSRQDLAQQADRQPHRLSCSGDDGIDSHRHVADHDTVPPHYDPARVLVHSQPDS